MKQENTQPLWKVLNEQRTQGEWSGRQSRGNNAYEFRVDANGGRVCEMEEAYDLENVKTVRANADYTALAVNNLHILAEALHKINCLCAEHTPENPINVGVVAKTSITALNCIR